MIVGNIGICYRWQQSAANLPFIQPTSAKEKTLLAKVLSSAVLGIDAYPVEVEVDITSGLPTFTTVGLKYP